MIISHHSIPQLDFIPCKELQKLLYNFTIIESNQTIYQSGHQATWKASYIISKEGKHVVFCDLLSTGGTDAHLRFSLETTNDAQHYSYADTTKDKIITKTIKSKKQAEKAQQIIRLLKAQIYISIYNSLEEQRKIYGTEVNTYKQEYDDLYTSVVELYTK